MKASPTVIYDIGMSGMVTRPMGRAELRRYLDVRYLHGRARRERGGGVECTSTTHLQESVLLGCG